MAENNLKLRLGIIRPRFNDYLKSKGRKSMSKKRFSKASLRKTSKHTLTQSMMTNSYNRLYLTTQPKPVRSNYQILMSLNG